jgi:hypothetical protein
MRRFDFNVGYEVQTGFYRPPQPDLFSTGTSGKPQKAQ